MIYVTFIERREPEAGSRELEGRGWRSAESFIEIVKKYSLYPLMTGSKVMCISKKVADIFALNNWKKVKVFNPGDELLQLEEKN